MALNANQSKPKHILVVDDSHPNVALLAKTLENAGYRVSRAYCGQESLRLTKQLHDEGYAPDLVLLDVIMPDMDGFEVCRQLKAWANEWDTFIPVVMLTALDRTEDKVAGFDSGADDYLVKPPDRDELFARVRSMIRIKDLQEGLFTTNCRLEEAQAQLQRELRIVAEIQRSFLPEVFPQHPNIEMDALYLPSALAGGDYYDVIEIDKNHWGLVVADVTGHGASAAVVMAVTHLLMRSFVNTFKFPSTALKVVNEKLNSHLSSEHFVTMFYGVLNLVPDKLGGLVFTYSSAGHNPMYLVRGGSGDVETLRTELGFPLRSFMSDEYDESHAQLMPGDKLILFTDGLVETTNRDGELFGEERLQVALRDTAGMSAKETVRSLQKLVTSFSGIDSFYDDLTLFVLHRCP